MKRICNIPSLILPLLLLLALPLQARGEMINAAECVRRAAAKLRSSGATTAAFTITGGGQSSSGDITISGRRFAINTPQSSSWFDGRNLYTYSAASGETTLTTPDEQEIAECNPLSYLSRRDEFRASFVPGSGSAVRRIRLVPKRRELPVDDVVVDLDSNTLLPRRLVVTPSGGSPVTVSIGKITVKATCPASVFAYPKGKYPGVKVIDLR